MTKIRPFLTDGSHVANEVSPSTNSIRSMPIRVLSQSLINKIAAGEVIERPASVVKELMENAIDAGATRVDVAVEQGGLEMIRVVDNGGGIPSEELPLALASHATSKLTDVDDLFRVGTLGFRGEALASIAEISRMVLSSRTPDSDGGAELETVGGRVGEVAPCGRPVGTSVEVHNLFFNTPVRRKFLKTTQTEFGHVAEAFTRIALAMPRVHFTLRHNEKLAFELTTSDGWLDRIARFFGRELADQLIWVENADGEIGVSGYVAHPSQSRSHNRMQYFFLNGRHIRDRALQHALSESYRGIMMTGRYPIAFMALRMPPEDVDVNVHPTKLEVRFQDSGRIYGQLLSTLRNKFLTTDLDTRVRTEGTDFGSETGPGFAATDERSAASAAATNQTAQWRQQLVDWAKGRVESWDRPDGGGAEAVAFGPRREDGGSALNSMPLRLNPLARSARFSPENPQDQTADDAPSFAENNVETGGVPTGEEFARIDSGSTFRQPSALQIHNRYLVTESEEGVMVIDQHALHERILYEHLRNRIDAGALETQSLLVPEPIDLSAGDSAVALEYADLLAELGLKIEPFGGDTILISSYPAMLANFRPADLLREVLDKIQAGGKRPERRDLLDELLHMIACKAAIKAGDRLTTDEIQSLLEQRHLVEDSHHCPHGRPTALIFTRDELDKQFKRV